MISSNMSKKGSMLEGALVYKVFTTCTAAFFIFMAIRIACGEASVKAND